MRKLDKPEIYNTEKNNIHPTAIVHPNVIIGNGNTIGAYTIIKECVKIGNNNYIGEHCIIGDIGESTAFFDEPKMGVIIGDSNRFTKQVTIDSGTVEATIIKSAVLMLKNAHVGHDARVESNCVLACNSIVGGFSIMETWSKLDLNAVVVPRVILRKGVRIGANSTLIRNAENMNKVYVGSPAKEIKSNTCAE